MGSFGKYGGRSTGRALESLRDCLRWNGPAENQLGAMRQDAGLTQSALASKSGVAQGYISAIESGDKKLSAPAAEKIGRALGVDAGVLLMSVKLGGLKSALETGEGRGPLTQEIIACMALISENLPDGSLKHLLLATLTESLTEAVEEDKSVAPQGVPQGAALKSRKRSPTRDQWGRRVRKDGAQPRSVGLKSKKKERGIVRDSFGVNKSKKNGRTA